MFRLTKCQPLLILKLNIISDAGSNNTVEKMPQTSLSALCSTENGTRNSEDNQEGISLDDYYKIFSVLTHIDDVDKVVLYLIALNIFLAVNKNGT